jgi:type IV secretory pathway VirB3-like protein
VAVFIDIRVAVLFGLSIWLFFLVISCFLLLFLVFRCFVVVCLGMVLGHWIFRFWIQKCEKCGEL